MELHELNQLSPEQALTWFYQTCAAQVWCQNMVAARPYDSIDEVQQQARHQWQALGKADFLQAFEAHPMIGDVNTLKAKFRQTQAMASHEQSGAAEASER